MRDKDPDHQVLRVESAIALGVAVRSRRLSCGRSQEAVAFDAGLSVHAYSCLERGRTPAGGIANPTLDTLLRIFTALEMDMPTLSI